MCLDQIPTVRTLEDGLGEFSVLDTKVEWDLKAGGWT